MIDSFKIMFREKRQESQMIREKRQGLEPKRSGKNDKGAKSSGKSDVPGKDKASSLLPEHRSGKNDLTRYFDSQELSLETAAPRPKFNRPNYRLVGVDHTIVYKNKYKII